MCLSTVHKTKPKKNGIGYKVFKKTRMGLHGEFQGDQVKLRPTQTWLRANEYYTSLRNFIRSENGNRYCPGWHILESIEAVKVWIGLEGEENRVIKKVRYGNAHTSGLQVICNNGTIKATARIIIADEIYIYKKEIR